MAGGVDGGGRAGAGVYHPLPPSLPWQLALAVAVAVVVAVEVAVTVTVMGAR